MTRRRRSLAVLAALLAASCRGVPLPDVEPANDEAAQRTLVADLLPPAVPAAMVQRWVLAHGRGEVFFTLYVRLEPPDSMGMVALSDLGATLASGTWTDGAAVIDRDSPAFPARMAKSILAVLAPVFLPGPPAEYELVRFPVGTLGLRRTHEGVHVLRWREGSEKQVRIAAGEGRTRSMATVTAWGVGAGARHPASLRLTDLTAGFDATVDVVRFDAVAAEGAGR